MEIFWIVVGVVVVILFVLSQNRTKITNRTVITRNKTVKTEDGEIRIQQTQVIDSASTQYTKPNTLNNENHSEYDKAVISDYYKQVSQQKAVESLRTEQQPFIQPQRVEKVVNPLSSPTEKPTLIENNTPVASGSKICTRCSRNLPLDKFRKSRKHSDGYTTWCAHCLDGPKNTQHTKWCPICEIRRKRTSYYKNANNRDGLMSWCKICWDSYKGKR